MNATLLADPAHVAGLRSKLISGLTGLSVPQLQYWHESHLLEAHARRGHRGVPRLYSWVDYQRLQVASELSAQGFPTRRIRVAIKFLDDSIAGWYRLPVRGMDGDIVVRTPEAEGFILATRSGQQRMEWPDINSSDQEWAETALTFIVARGPLGLLRSFDDAVIMDPDVNLAQPTVRGTALETQFINAMSEDIGVDGVVSLYRLRKEQITRAMEFERAVA